MAPARGSIRPTEEEGRAAQEAGLRPSKDRASAWRAVVFDIEGVVAHQDAARANEELAQLRPGLSVADLRRTRDQASLYPLWVAYSKGRLTPEVYWSAVLQALGLPPNPSNIERLRDIQRRTWWAQLDRAVLAVAHRLHRLGYRLATLSNSAPEHDANGLARTQLFAVMHFSHLTGRRKPDAAAYLGVLHELGVEPAETVFIDDKPRNVAAAQALGIAAVLFRDAGQLEAALDERGLFGVQRRRTR